MRGPRCFRWAPFLSVRREQAVIHRWLRFPQMFLWFPLRCSTCQKSEVRNPKARRFRIERSALSPLEGVERVSRVAARLCERPRSLPTRSKAPAELENHGARKPGRSYASGREPGPDSSLEGIHQRKHPLLEQSVELDPKKYQPLLARHLCILLELSLSQTVLGI